MTAALEVEDLRLSARSPSGDVELVHGVSFSIGEGETLGIVGESGSGKSLTMLATMQLLGAGLQATGGRVLLDGEELLAYDEERMRDIRGSRLAMIYQDPLTSLNPVLPLGRQLDEGMLAHGFSPAEARARSMEMLDEVGIGAPEATRGLYPHHLSGGMRQRVMIACALAMRPRVLIADEPTTALDVTIQQQILALVYGVQERTGMAVIWVSHDLGVIARAADRVVVMYAGRVVEAAPVKVLFASSQHPYTRALLDALPDPDDDERRPLVQLSGRALTPGADVSGCPFAGRCPQRRGRCVEEAPPLARRGASLVACWIPPEEWA